MNDLKSDSFNIPDWLSFAPALYQLLGGGADFPNVPGLDEYNISPEKIGQFFNARRAVTRAGIQRQGAQATRTAVGNLPSSLSESTIPASITGDIQTKVADVQAGADVQLAGEEQNAYFSAYQTLLQKLGLQTGIAGQKRKDTFDATELLAFLPLLA